MTEAVKQSLINGLNSCPKYIPTWYKYDLLGSELEHDCRDSEKNKDYYLYRCMVSCLQANIQDIVPDSQNCYTLVDLGSGNCSKTRHVIDQLLKKQNHLSFYPLDISKEFLMRTADKLSQDYGEKLTIHPTAENYVNGIEKMSTDITQDETSILKAYDDVQDFHFFSFFLFYIGLHKRFFLNSITRMNGEFGSQVNTDRFRYIVDFVSGPNSDISYVRAYLEAKDNVTFPIPGLGMELHMQKNERLFFHEKDTGVSCKYTMEQIQTLTNRAGLQLTDTWTDDQRHAVICRCVKKN
ncbi:histidine N-alpha-methyltransferase-like [Ylistrum balloti]|uniref:histidine N-alpha-methyltransferase-like n=1 Tax=Ylistrum balloti TaxID=509963 RepID=UPI002905B5A4|nr:histidine N-alpha-methyltransferase-like [Ylistrum balloti]